MFGLPKNTESTSICIKRHTKWPIEMQKKCLSLQLLNHWISFIKDAFLLQVRSNTDDGNADVAVVYLRFMFSVQSCRKRKHWCYCKQCYAVCLWEWTSLGRGRVWSKGLFVGKYRLSIGNQFQQVCFKFCSLIQIFYFPLLFK